MKKYLTFLFFVMVLLSLSACGGQKQSSVTPSSTHAKESSVKNMSISNISYKPITPIKVSTVCLQPDYVTNILMSYITYVNNAGLQSQNKASSKQIRVQGEDGNSIIFELNDSSAANDLYAQLPLYIQVEDYSTNEKIFYPEKLDTTDTPKASGATGTLAYYAPWGDVVMFYGEYNENPALYELGHVISGIDFISTLSGSIQIEENKSEN